MKPSVARLAVQAGASVINDIAANREDETMARVLAESGAGYVLMHMQGTPATMQTQPAYDDVVEEVETFFISRLDRLKRAGVPPERVALDVGIGFGKTPEHTLQLLAGLGRFTKLGRPLLLGVSRKSFIGRISGDLEAERLSGALACTVLAAEAGVRIFRTHDVAATVRALRMTEAVLARA